MAKKYDIKSLVQQLNDKKKTKENGNNFMTDFWRPTIEKGEERVEYIIRFLENPDTKTGFANVDRHTHMFKFPNGKYISKACAKRAGREPKCYICEEASKLWETKEVAKQNIAKERFAKARFFYNILVIKDSRENGKNEGKVFLFEAGKQIQDKCSEFLLNPEIKEEELCFFHPQLGTNFKIVVTTKSDYANYDKSDFMRSTSPIEVNGKKLSEQEADEFIENNCKKLNEYLFADKNFSSYEELKALYQNQGIKEVTTETVKPNTKDAEEIEEEEEDEDRTVKNKKIEVRNPPKGKVTPVVDEDEEEEPPFDVDEEEEEDEELARLLADSNDE